MTLTRREALAVGLWIVRLSMTRTRCLYVAESSLAAAERLGSIRPAVSRRHMGLISAPELSSTAVVVNADMINYEPIVIRVNGEIDPATLIG